MADPWKHPYWGCAVAQKSSPPGFGFMPSLSSSMSGVPSPSVSVPSASIWASAAAMLASSATIMPADMHVPAKSWVAVPVPPATVS